MSFDNQPQPPGLPFLADANEDTQVAAEIEYETREIIMKSGEMVHVKWVKLPSLPAETRVKPPQFKRRRRTPAPMSPVAQVLANVKKQEQVLQEHCRRLALVKRYRRDAESTDFGALIAKWRSACIQAAEMVRDHCCAQQLADTPFSRAEIDGDNAREVQPITLRVILSAVGLDASNMDGYDSDSDAFNEQ